MSRVCQVTGKKPMLGNNVSHANNKTRRRFLPNLQYRRIWVETENRWVSLRLSQAGLRTIDRKASTSCSLKCGRAASKSEESSMREKIKLESSAGTGHFYTTTKNKRTKPDKMELMKFDPVARKHVIYKETKIK